MEIRRIDKDVTELKLNNKKYEFVIKQLKFFGATPVKETRTYTYFKLNGSMEDCKKYLGIK